MSPQQHNASKDMGGMKLKNELLISTCDFVHGDAFWRADGVRVVKYE